MLKSTGPLGYRALSGDEVARLLGTDTKDPLFDIVPTESKDENSVPAFAGITSTITTKMGQFSPYDFETRRAYWEYEEFFFYRDYKKMWRQNPYAWLVVEYLLNEIFGDGYHFEGEGEDTVEEFFNQDDTRRKLLIAFRQAILLGNGFLDLKVGSLTSNLKSTSVIDAATVNMVLENGETVYTQTPSSRDYKSSTKTGSIRINPKRLMHFRIKEYPDTPYGISLLRPNLHFLRALEDTAGDIPAAVKRIAYSPLVAKLDLDNYGSAAEKETVLKDFSEKLHKVISASTNYVMDKRHEMSLVGSGGGAGARLLPVVQLIEPLIAVVLFNFGIPLGMLLQAGSNRAILREQTEGLRRFIYHIRQSLKRDIDLNVIPRITGSMNAKLVYDDDFSDWVRKGVFLARLYERGLLSREYVLDTLNVDDDGETFFAPQGGGPGGNLDKLPLRDDQLEDTDLE